MTASATIRYEITVRHRDGIEHVRPYASEKPLSPGDVVRLEGRYWLVETADEPGADGASVAARAKPAGYRLRLRHPDGHEELGAFRRYRPDAPRIGHAFSTAEDGQAVSWEVVDEQLAYEEGEPYLDLIAKRDYSELEELPDHELEHTLGKRAAQLPDTAAATLARAAEAGFAVELAALEPGEEPDWAEAEAYIEALILAEIEDDLLELCGVDPDTDPRDTWLDTVKERLRDDLRLFRRDIEGDHDEIEEWEFADGRVFAAVGSPDDEADPNKGYGWMCRLVDSGALGAAGFERVRKAELWR
jgi:hypothetical protein